MSLPAFPPVPITIEEAVGVRRTFRLWSRNFNREFVAHRQPSSRIWQVTGRLGSWERLTDIQRYFDVDPTTGIDPLVPTTAFDGQGIAARR